MADSNYDHRTDPHHKGEKTHPRLQDGPITDRGCSDFLCFIIYGAFWAGLVFIAIYSFTTGDPKTVLSPFDSYGDQCGVGNFSDYPYLYWGYDGQDMDYNLSVCVKLCPTNNEPPNCNQSKYCNSTAFQYYNSTVLGGTLCIPTDTGLKNELSSTGAYAQNVWEQAMSDMRVGWWVLCVVAGSALVIGFIYLFLMRFCTGVVTWGIIILYFIALLVFGLLCLGEASSATVQNYAPEVLQNIPPTFLNVIGYITLAIFLISLIVMCCTCKKIELAIAVLKCASEFVEQVPTTLLIPPFFFLIGLAFYIFWFFMNIYLVGTNPISATPGGFPFADRVEWSPKSELFIAYNIFGLLWNHAFLAALPQFVIASACCMWYFSQNTGTPPESPVCKSMTRGIFLHLGSMAFGSLTIAILDFFKLFIGIFEKSMRHATSGDDPDHCLTKYCLSCSSCCLGCFDRILKFITKNAYIQIAMTGENFCKASQEAFYLALRNAFKFSAVHGIGAIFIFIGQILITVLSTLVGYLIITQSPYFVTGLYSPVYVTIACFLIALIVSNVFMSVYGVAGDTIIQCYCMDEEMNDGVPKNSPKMLQEFLEIHQSFHENQKQLLNDHS